MVDYQVTVILKLFERTWLPGEVPPLEQIRTAATVQPEDIYNLRDFFAERLTRVAAITQLLLNRGWRSRGSKEAVILEGNDLEAHEVKEAVTCERF
ncbi:hypothetical protein [Thermodesulfitimonas sp.]